MSDRYAVEFTGKAADQTRGWPAEVYVSLVLTLRAVARDPWANSSPDPDDGPPAFRWAPFAAGLGAASVYVDELARVVRVHDVTWIG